MNTEYRQEPRHVGFLMGLFAGTAIGAGLAMWFAPRAASELRGRVTRSTVGETVGDFVQKSRDVRDDVATAVERGAHEVARGAHEVERFAKSVKS